MTNSYRCPFARALLSGHSRCQFAESFHIAERHGMQCKDAAALKPCEDLAAELHKQSSFALGVTHLPKPMTSNMELRIQCGGINGIVKITGSSTTSDYLIDIYSLLRLAVDQFGSIEALPYSRVMQSISQWKPRRRGGSHKKE
ncbi:MAG: hypothetical protein HON68_06505 [Gammaproteobacteria bacterium]|nr:hypothetical protein [Gammaproteobacteria bacterium]MBT3489530.1 hypothetical protein [Gammaproteobacteria bacterium]MBT3718870.1 hypothetical protein [Gammaproteobacteria bacterium]MBT3845042.1 hypothetical protein [Gammaproteobacteria bacterium]MBT3893631.1 hypothetical protein [Gammaproteobacteria bacterium]